jgi:hypothetical protein
MGISAPSGLQRSQDSISFSALRKVFGVDKHNLLFFRCWVKEVPSHNGRSVSPRSTGVKRSEPNKPAPLVYLLAFNGGYGDVSRRRSAMFPETGRHPEFFLGLFQDFGTS